MSDATDVGQLPPDDDTQLWPMGAVTRRTGIGEHTLRAWERRFGFPAPYRLESGHRRYPADQVQQLLLINAALDCGYRAGDVVPLERSELEDLLRACGALDVGVTRHLTDAMVTEIFDACRRFDRDALSAALSRDASVLGVGAFLRERAAPLLEKVGEAWRDGALEIRHEHFFSEVLEDQLRSMRASLEASDRGRPVVLATLPDELHGLGLQLVALAVAASGRTVRVLGPFLPVEEIVRAAEALEASAVGISVTAFGVGERTTAEITQLRDALPARTRVWLGGAGAGLVDGLPDGVEVLASFDELESALREI